MSPLREIFEPEETVGGFWHRLVGDVDSYPHYPDAAVHLEQVKGQLGVLFRGLGGDPGVGIADAIERPEAHRLTWLQRLGREAERHASAQFDRDTLRLPPVIDLFADADLNRDLYVWLTAYFTTSPLATLTSPADPLQADLAALRLAHETADRALALYPGLAHRYERLRQRVLAIRPNRSLPPAEAAMEALVVSLLKDEPPTGPAAELWQARAVSAPRGYRPFLPVPLWGRFSTPRQAQAQRRADDGRGGGGETVDARTRAARRRRLDQTERDDPLILNRFEKILSWAEMLNINRQVEDDDPETARQASDDLDEITVSEHRKAAATKLQFDLDLPPNMVDPTRLVGDALYPEWDYRGQRYHRDHCRVVAAVAAEDGESWTPDAAVCRRIQRVRRQFEALRPRRVVLRAQRDGSELDLDALVRSRCDLVGAGALTDAIYLDAREQARDLAVAILADVSLSTDSWIEGRRVLDVEKEALTVLTHGLNACGDDFAVYAFTSRKRDAVLIHRVKTFREAFGDAVTRRIASLRPGYYTRIGAAVRHAADELKAQPHRHRLLLVLTDGKPNDLDHYEGRYGVEDTRKAIQEARRVGLSVFGVTVDREAKDYFPYMFGRGGFSIIGHIDHLATALSAIYGQLVR